jgi:2-hydroxy-3-keto-5-methylthiopentenyl-1-phosphate phosphatase
VSPRESALQGPGKPIAVLCDFDGTIVLGDTTAAIYARYGTPLCQELNQRWIRREIGTMEEMQGCFSTMKASKKDLEAVLAQIPVDAAFPAFVDFCRCRGYAFAVLSDGLVWVIKYVLGLQSVDGLTVYANELHFEADGLRVSFPWHDPAAPMRGVSKHGIIRRYQAEGYKVVYIGDGPTDLEVVGVADVLCARDELLHYCRERAIAAIGFTDLADLMANW